MRLLHDFGTLIPEHQRQLVPVSWTLLADPYALCALWLNFVALRRVSPGCLCLWLGRGQAVMYAQGRGLSRRRRFSVRRTTARTLKSDHVGKKEQAHLYSPCPTALAALRGLAAVDHGRSDSSGGEGEGEGLKRVFSSPGTFTNPLRESDVLLQSSEQPGS